MKYGGKEAGSLMMYGDVCVFELIREFVYMCWLWLCMFFWVVIITAFMPERSKGFDSSSNVFVLVGSNPTECIWWSIMPQITSINTQEWQHFAWWFLTPTYVRTYNNSSWWLFVRYNNLLRITHIQHACTHILLFMFPIIYVYSLQCYTIFDSKKHMIYLVICTCLYFMYISILISLFYD